MGVNNFIKSKVLNLINSKRCPKCLKQIKLKNVSIAKQIGFTNKIKFVFAKPEVKLPIKKKNNYYINNDKFWANRKTISPFKVRFSIPVTCIEVYCNHCNNSFEIEVNVNAI